MKILRTAKRLVTGTRIARRLKRQILERVTVNSQLIFVRPNSPDIDVAKSCFEGEFDTAINFASPLQHNFIIDAGGYIGTAAIVFAKAFPAAKVITLEPSIENFYVLKKNVAPFKNIIAINRAIASTIGKCALVDRWSGQWGFSTFSEMSANCPDPVKLHTVETITIASLLERFNEDGIDILKLDIEGAEHDLMKTSSSWISKTRIIVAELHDNILPGCEAVFERATAGRSNSYGLGEKILSVMT